MINLRTKLRSFYPPLSINAPFKGYLKLVKVTQKGEKLKQCSLESSLDLVHRTGGGGLEPRPNYLAPLSNVSA